MDVFVCGCVCVCVHLRKKKKMRRGELLSLLSPKKREKKMSEQEISKIINERATVNPMRTQDKV